MSDQQSALFPDAILPPINPRTITPPSNGRPKGARARKNAILDRLLETNKVAVMERVIAEACAGDMVAAKLILDRVMPRPRTAPVVVDLPDAQTPGELRAAMHEVFQRVAAGEITTDDGAALLAMMRDIIQAHSIQTADGARLPGLIAAADPRAALLARLTKVIERRRSAAAGDEPGEADEPEPAE